MRHFTRSDLCALVDALDLCARSDRATELEEALERATAIVPYSAALCVIGDTRSRTLMMAVTKGFPRACLRSYVDQHLQRVDASLAASLGVGRAHLRASLGCAPADPRVAALEQRFQVPSSESACGVHVDPDGVGTYLHLSRPTEPPSSRHLRAIDLLMPHLHRAMLRIARRPEDGHAEMGMLTGRELAVLRWAKEGKTAWETAQILSVSEATVKFHLANVFRKLEVVNKGHAVAKAMQFGLLARTA